MTISSLIVFRNSSGEEQIGYPAVNHTSYHQDWRAHDEMNHV